MKFLITNDDGISAPGISALATAASRFGEIVVVAPEDAHSGCGHRVTTYEPISVRADQADWWAIGGTPADCARVGIRELASDCDWVLAGVNAGANLGVDVFMSGTVAAVREGALLGRPGIAFSHYRTREGAFDWGFAADETLTMDELFAEKYSGIRPAPGYPACPDHRHKRIIHRLLEAEKIGAGLTESCAMTPSASVAGFYFAAPEARYFSIGSIDDEQLADMAKRRDESLEECQRWLAPLLLA